MFVLPDIRKAQVKGKKIFLRSDVDVPLSSTEQIVDDTRLVDGMPTMQYLLSEGSTIIIGGHLGRPNGEYKKELSLQPVAEWLSKRIMNHESGIKEERIGELDGWRIGDNLFLLENLRFYKEEEDNDSQFAQKLASLLDIYVNDAFAVSHRNHASVAGVAKLLPHYAGIRLQKEIEVLGNLTTHPKRPLVVIIGGAKLETKLPLVERMHHFADYVLVGGKLTHEVKELIKVQHEKIESLPNGHKSILLVADTNTQGTDVTPYSIENFKQIIQDGATIVWNGPLGKMESLNGEGSERGTQEIAEAILGSSAYSVVGGGDTLEFLRKRGLSEKFSFCSTGGGAMLAFLSGEILPGLKALQE